MLSLRSQLVPQTHLQRVAVISCDPRLDSGDILVSRMDSIELNSQATDV